MDPIFNPITTMAAAVAACFVVDLFASKGRRTVLWDVEWINETGLRRMQFFAEDLAALQRLMEGEGVRLRSVVSVRQIPVSA